MPPTVSAKAILAESWTRTLVVGHRGAADEAPENSLAAFEAGLASGASAVECDIHLSADGEIVVMHDATLDRTTPLKGWVDATPWTVMQAAGVPSLREVVRLVRGRGVLVVEIKAGEGIEERVVDLIREEGTIEATIFFAFQDDPIRRVKALAPESIAIRLLLLGESLRSPSETLAKVRALRADGVGIDHRCAWPGFVQNVQNGGLPVFSWTVPPGPPVERLRADGVNFIITNHPRAVRAQLEDL